MNDPPGSPEPTDPVRVRRARWERTANQGQRLGYLLYGLAIVVFLVGFVVGLSPATVSVIVASMVVGSALLLPSIIVGYAVKAAEREDRERGI